MRTISVVMSSKRDQNKTQSIVDVLYDTHPNTSIDVVVASPNFEISRATNVHDRDIGGKGDNIGANRSMVGTLDKTRGDYVAWLSDSTRPTPGCLDVMADYIDRRPTPFIGEFFVGDQGGQAGFGDYEFLGHRWTIPFARWGMMSRKSIEMIGFFSPEFFHHFADIDLSIRCWRAGGSVEICRDSRIEHRNLYDSNADSAIKDRDVLWRRHPELAGRHM